MAHGHYFGYEYDSPPPRPSRLNYYNYPDERHRSRSTEEGYFQRESAPPSRQAEYPSRVKREQTWDAYYGDEYEKYEDDFNRTYVPREYYFERAHHGQGQFEQYQDDYDQRRRYSTHVQNQQRDIGYYDDDDDDDDDDEKTDIDDQYRQRQEHTVSDVDHDDDEKTDIDEQGDRECETAEISFTTPPNEHLPDVSKQPRKKRSSSNIIIDDNREINMKKKKIKTEKKDNVPCTATSENDTPTGSGNDINPQCKPRRELFKSVGESGVKQVPGKVTKQVQEPVTTPTVEEREEEDIEIPPELKDHM